MLIIGHRGAAGLARENTLEALRAGIEADADMLEFDIRLTKDRVLVLNHDFHTLRTHHSATIISHHTLKELRERLGTQTIVTFEEVLDEFLGKILLNVEIKGFGTGHVAAEFVKKHYIKKQSDWDNLLFSSFLGSELSAIREVSQQANLALLHHENPFMFIGYNRRLQLSAVGFHRLYVSELALEIAKRASLFTYIYTIDRPHTALLLSRKGVDGIVTNRPDIILEEINREKEH